MMSLISLMPILLPALMLISTVWLSRASLNAYSISVLPANFSSCPFSNSRMASTPTTSFEVRQKYFVWKGFISSQQIEFRIRDILGFCELADAGVIWSFCKNTRHGIIPVYQQRILYYNLKIVKEYMKQLPPPPELRIVLTNLVSTLNLSPQTHHNTIFILMHLSLPELANQDLDICVAALFISQKLHQIHPYSVAELCNRTGVHQNTILAMELMIVRALGFRLIGGGLLIDECIGVAAEWDKFINGITCIDVRFFPLHSLQSIHDEQENEAKISVLSTFTYRILLETIEKLGYRMETSKHDKLKLSIAVVSMCIKQAERYQTKTPNNINIGSNCKQISRKMIKMGKVEHKSTEYIIQDFMNDVYGLGFEQIREEITYAKGMVTELRDLTTTFRSIRNSQKNQSKRSGKRS